MSKMNKIDFFHKFSNMKPMKYQEPDLTKPKALDMLNNVGDEYIAMRKHDGEWCRAIIHDKGVLLQSRSISKVTGTYGVKTDVVPHITEELKSKWPAGTVLLGELAFDDYTSTSRDAGSVLRCKPPKAILRQKDKKIHLFVFDMLAYEYEDLTERPFEERISHYPYIQDAVYFRQVESLTGPNADFMAMADNIWALGGEGLVIVRKDMIYEPGKRPAWKSAKVKKKMGILEAKVISFIEPNRIYDGDHIDDWKFFVDKDDKPADVLSMIDYGDLTAVTKPYYYGWKNGVVVEFEGRTIKVTSGLTDKDREWCASNEASYMVDRGELIAEITGMEMTEDSIRHPIFKNFKEK